MANQIGNPLSSANDRGRTSSKEEEKYSPGRNVEESPNGTKTVEEDAWLKSEKPTEEQLATGEYTAQRNRLEAFKFADTVGGLHPRYNSLATEEAKLSAPPVFPSFVGMPMVSGAPVSGLDSHPPGPTVLPRRSATLPERRRTSFNPLPISHENSEDWAGKDLPSTPYPGRGTGPSHSEYTPSTQQRHAGHHSSTHGRRPKRLAKEETMNIMLQDRATSVVHSELLYLPLHSARKGGAFKHNHDDEELGRRLRDAYLSLRGPWKSLVLARSIIAVHMHEHGESEHLTLAHKHRRSNSPDTISDTGSIDSHASLCATLLELFHHPSRGRASTAAIEQNCAAARSNCEATIELVEGWSFPRISFACVVVMLASVAATLLWVFLGVGEIANFALVNATSASDETNTPITLVTETTHVLPQSPGDRVEAGAMLGGLVLLLGWSFVGMWVFLSYLVT